MYSQQQSHIIQWILGNTNNSNTTKVLQEQVHEETYCHAMHSSSCLRYILVNNTAIMRLPERHSTATSNFCDHAIQLEQCYQQYQPNKTVRKTPPIPFPPMSAGRTIHHCVLKIPRWYLIWIQIGRCSSVRPPVFHIIASARIWHEWFGSVWYRWWPTVRC